MRALSCTGGIEDDMLYGGAIVAEKGILRYAKIPEEAGFFPGKDIALTSLYIKELYALFNLKKEPATNETSAFFDVLDEVYVIINNDLVKCGSEDDISSTLKQLFESSGVHSIAKGTIIKKRIEKGSWKGISYYAIN